MGRTFADCDLLPCYLGFIMGNLKPMTNHQGGRKRVRIELISMLPPTIQLTQNPGPDLQKFLSDRKYSGIAVLADENTLALCYPLIKDHLPAHTLIKIQSGEESKTLPTCSIIWQAMTDAKLDRHAALIVIGGGVLGDMGGFCAATYKRGIDFILIPTTLLAQADSSIGGKLGIDFNHFKNHIGVFQEPALNLVYSGFLKTLPEHELRSGFAEVIKHALISDGKLWDEIRLKDLKSQPWNTLVPASVEFKHAIVNQDPHEKGLRKILNAGHTIGHAIESYFLAKGDRILHGEAIAAGLIAEGYLGVKKGLLNEESLKDIGAYIIKVFGKLGIQKNQITEIASLCIQDKKNKGNRVLCVLPDGIGRAKYDVEINLGEIEDCLAYYSSLLQT
jgi:3-dehydroquinate synthase